VTTVSRAGAPSWPDEALARLPEVLCLGQPRLTAGLDRSARLDIAAHQAVFGPLPRLSATQLVKITAAADLRGRGGAAFPLARKISAVLESVRERRCGSAVLVNAAEGEPGSAKDRTLLLRSPYLVLGGAMVAAWALGARQIVVGAADPHVAQSVRDAADADPELRKLIRVAEHQVSGPFAVLAGPEIAHRIWDRQPGGQQRMNLLNESIEALGPIGFQLFVH